MQHLNFTAAELQPGDTIQSIDGATARQGEILLTTGGAVIWDDCVELRTLEGQSRILTGDCPVTVSRPETGEEKQVIAEKMYRWMLMLTHNPFGEYPGVNDDHLNLLWLMYGRDGERDEKFTEEIQARFEADYDERCTIVPC